MSGVMCLTVGRGHGRISEAVHRTILVFDIEPVQSPHADQPPIVWSSTGGHVAAVAGPRSSGSSIGATTMRTAATASSSWCRPRCRKGGW